MTNTKSRRATAAKSRNSIGEQYVSRRTPALADGSTRRELFESTDVTLRVDFHSFRRAYATALAEVAADGRLSMLLNGHKSLATRNLYVMRSGTIKMPESALPKVPLG
jgi:site-specific recombinase XerD